MTFRKKRRAKSLVPKPETRSRVSKGPARDPEHLAKVREKPCAVCGCWGDIEAHHVRCISGRTMGVRKSDYFAVALCRSHHAMLHNMNEQKFWNSWDRDPAAWISAFSEEGRCAIEELRKMDRTVVVK